MYIRSESDASPSPASPGDLLCPPSYPNCDPSLSAGPALTNIKAEGNPTDTTTDPSNPVVPTNGSTLQPVAEPGPAIPQAALAANIQHIGRRNFVGIVVIAVFVFVGLVLWLSFGKWPRAGVRRLKARFKRGDQLCKDPGGCSRTGQPCAQDEKHEDQTTHSEAPCSPQSVEVEIERLDKHAGKPQKEMIPRVHFA
ncbi:hypothetical protein BD414DRAFT_534726 [Trametes punicea]|nr:hypothetical protein BD414DRAFT_534726 [Trametes punicea]